jgi:hypothetical protein
MGADRWLGVLLLVLLVVPCRGEIPFAAVAPALADAAASGDAGALRYVSLANIPAGERILVKRRVDFVLNGFDLENLTPILTAPLARGLVLRVDLAALAIDPRDWDAVVESGSGQVPIPEPYASVLLRKEIIDVYEHGHWTYPGGKKTWSRTRISRERTGRFRTELAVGPWMTPDGGKAMALLGKLTGAKAPIIRADWLLATFTLAPGYTRLLGINPRGKLAAFDRRVGVDEVLARRSRTLWVADTRRVTLHVRIGDRFALATSPDGGAYHRTWDSDKGIDRADYLNTFADAFLVRAKGRSLFRDKLDHTATEVVASTPKGAHAYALTDAKDNLLDVAVASVASDRRTGRSRLLADAQVWSAWSCIVCHDRYGGGGFWTVPDKVRALASGRIALGVQETLARTVGRSKARLISRDISNALSRDPNLFLKGDMARYAAFVAATTGDTVEDNAADLEERTVDYWGGVTPASAAREVGIPEADMIAILKRARGLDANLVGLLQTPAIPIPRLVYERAAYAQLATLLTTTGAYSRRRK